MLYQVILSHTVGFHNFNLRIVNLRVSIPNKLVVDVLMTQCRISMCQGLGPNKHEHLGNRPYLRYYDIQPIYTILNYTMLL